MSYTPPAGNAIDLNLAGSYSIPAGDAVELDLGGAGGAGSVQFSAAGDLGALSGEATIGYDNAVPRPLAVSTGLPFDGTARRPQETASAWRSASRREVGTASAWKEAQRADTEVGSDWRSAAQRKTDTSTPWGTARKAETGVSAPFVKTVRKNVDLALDWGRALELASEIVSPFERLKPFNQSPTELAFRDALALSAMISGGFKRRAKVSNEERAIPWGTAAILTSFGSPPYLPIEPPPPGLSITLDLKCPPLDQAANELSLTLSAFECNGSPPSGGGAISIPIRRVYFVTNTVSIVRLPGREPIKATDVQLSTDSASWAWGVRASIAREDLDLVEPVNGVPTKIEVSINGVSWVLAVEGISEERTFGRSSASITGRSLSAALAAPYVRPRTREEATAKNAQQLAADELALTGFSLDWRATDWLVPGGAFSYSGLTPIDAISKIVGAVGGYLQSHRTDEQLIALPRYPVPPWEWATATPDASVPYDVAKSLGAQYEQAPDVNAVFVSGERYGVAATVRRLGTIGDKFGGQFVDPLLTANDALRARGIAELGKAGRSARVSLELPILPAYGILTPGQLVQFTDAGAVSWRGLVRSLSASAQVSERTIRVSQRVELERRLS